VGQRAALLAIVLAAGAAAPAAAPAARPACGKRVACKGKLRAMRTGMPLSWAKRTPLPGRGDDTVPGTQPPGGGTTPAKPGAPPPPPPPPPPPDDPRYVQVVARDSDPDHWELQLSRTTLLSGSVEVEFNNRFAEDPHDLWIRRDATTYKFDQVANGESATKHVALAAGTWKLWCNIPGHEQQGMVAQVTVSNG
jgi:sulfocyanin SoxE-like protein